MIFHITAQGNSRMNDAANPILSFVPNFPPCLQIDEIPATNVDLSTEQLLEYLPKTGTIGEMVTFLFTFVFSAPYEPLIPLAGLDRDLFFSGDQFPRSNAALIAFRKVIQGFIPEYSPDSPLIHQWPMSIET